MKTSWGGSDFLDAAGLSAGQVDAELLGGAEDVFLRVAHLDRAAVLGQHLDVEAERLHLLDENLERLGDPGVGDVLALHDGLVDLDATGHVVGLDGEQLLQGVGGAVRLHGPDLHLTEALATELGLTAERLLGDHGVRTGRTRVDLVVDQVVELEDVHVTHRHRLRERLAGTTVEQVGLSVLPHHAVAVTVGDGRAEQADDLVLAGTVEDRGGHVGVGLGLVGLDLDQALLPVRGTRGTMQVEVPTLLGDPAEVELEDLTDVHPSRDAQRVQDHVDRGAVLGERHVLDRQDLRDDALVAVTAGELVTHGDLALLGDIDPHQLVHTRRQLVAVLAVELADSDDSAGLTVRHLHRGVAHLARLLTEDRAEQALLGGQLRLTLGGHLADENVTGGDLRADPDDAALVEVGEQVVADVRDVAGDLLGTELSVAGVDLVLLDVDRGEHVLLHQALAQDDRVLVVVSLPGHEGDEQVGAQRHLALVGARTVGEWRTDFDAVTFCDQRTLVDAGALVGSRELQQAVGLVPTLVGHDHDLVGRDLPDHAGHVGGDDVTRVDGGTELHAGADEVVIMTDEWHRLALHVGAHERAVGVVVLEERDESGRHRHHLARRDVHVLDLVTRDVDGLTTTGAHQHALVGEVVVVVEHGVGLRDDPRVLLIGRQVVDLVGDVTVLHHAVGRLDEAERVDPSVGRERADQSDVGTLRGLDRAHAAVVRGVHVADVHLRAVTGDTARAQRGETTLVRQTGDRVGLVHELRELGGSEELLQRRHHGPDVDQRLRRDRLDVLGRHPLADDSLHPRQTRAELVLDQLADGAHATVAEVVDVVLADLDRLVVGVLHLVALRVDQVLLVGVQLHDVADRRHDVVDGQRLLVEGLVGAELLVDLVATDLGEVVALGVEVVVLQQRLRSLTRRGLTRAQLAVDVEQRIVLGLGVVLLQGEHHRLVLAELFADLLVGPAEGLEQHRDVLLALAVQAYADHVALVDLELQPRTARRDHLGGEDVLVGGLVGGPLEVDTGRPDELGDHDTLGAVDDEGALAGHHREVTHEDRLALDLTGLAIGELSGDIEGAGVGEVLLLALLLGVLRVEEDRVLERERHRLGEVLDRGDLLEDLVQPRLLRELFAGAPALRDLVLPLLAAHQPAEAVGLEGEQLRNLEWVGNLCEGNAAGTVDVAVFAARGGQEWSFRGSHV